MASTGLQGVSKSGTRAGTETGTISETGARSLAGSGTGGLGKPEAEADNRPDARVTVEPETGSEAGEGSVGFEPLEASRLRWSRWRYRSPVCPTLLPRMAKCVPTNGECWEGRESSESGASWAPGSPDWWANGSVVGSGIVAEVAARLTEG